MRDSYCYQKGDQFFCLLLVLDIIHVDIGDCSEVHAPCFNPLPEGRVRLPWPATMRAECGRFLALAALQCIDGCVDNRCRLECPYR